MSDVDAGLWAAFSESMAALDESAAVELEIRAQHEQEARAKFHADSEKLTDMLAREDWEGIANEFGASNSVGQTREEDGTGTQPVQDHAGEQPDPIDEGHGTTG